MNVEALQGLMAHDEVPGTAPPASALPASGPSFGNLVSEGLRTVNDRLLASQADLQGLALGEAGNLHEVMIRLEESRIAFQLALQVRNRLLESYQEVMRMQV